VKLTVRGVLALLSAAAFPASALETFSAPIRSLNGDKVVCVVQNLSDQTVSVEAVLHDGFGGVANSGDDDVMADRTAYLADSNAEMAGGYCQFSFDGDADEVRGYVQFLGADGGDTRLVFPAAGTRGPPQDGQETYSPPLRNVENKHIGCGAQNLSDETVVISAEILDIDGVVVIADEDPLPAGGAGIIVDTVAASTGAYCHFTFDGSLGKIRTYGMLYESMASVQVQFPASEAEGVGAAAAVTPPLTSADGIVTTCIVQNLGEETVEVGGVLRDLFGVIDSGSVVVAPGHVATLVSTNAATSAAICTFTFDSARDVVRGFIMRYDAGISNTRLLGAALPRTGAAGGVGTTTYSPPLRSHEDVMTCSLVNVTDQNLAVLVEIYNDAGNVVATDHAVAQAGRGQNSATTAATLTRGYCKFTFDGSPDDIRGYANLAASPGLLTRMWVPAAPIGPLTPFPTHTATVTQTPTVTATRSDTPSPTETSTVLPSLTRTTTATPTATITATPPNAPSSTYTSTAPPTSTPTTSVTAPVQPTAIPTFGATDTPGPNATATPTPVGSPGATSTGAATPNETRSPTPVPEPSATPAPCVGDCDGDAHVSIGEIVTLVGTALGNDLDCPAGDRDHDGEITIGELLAAVVNALEGCGAPG